GDGRRSAGAAGRDAGPGAVDAPGADRPAHVRRDRQRTAAPPGARLPARGGRVRQAAWGGGRTAPRQAAGGAVLNTRGQTLRAVLAALAWSCACVAAAAASLAEAAADFQRGDHVAALQKYVRLANTGDAEAQRI